MLHKLHCGALATEDFTFTFFSFSLAFHFFPFSLLFLPQEPDRREVLGPEESAAQT